MGTVRLMAAGMAVVALGGACGAGGGSPTNKAIPSAHAAALAERADRVATDLAAGACDQALAEARSLQSDLAGLQIDGAVRDQAVAGAARLADSINCAPPPTVSTVPAVPAVVVGPGGHGPGKGKKHKGDRSDD
jgi:hypothetical protein